MDSFRLTLSCLYPLAGSKEEKIIHFLPPLSPAASGEILHCIMWSAPFWEWCRISVYRERRRKKHCKILHAIFSLFLLPLPALGTKKRRGELRTRSVWRQSGNTVPCSFPFSLHSGSPLGALIRSLEARWGEIVSSPFPLPLLRSCLLR